MKVITIYALIDAFKINGALARRGIRELLSRNLIVPVVTSGAMCVYTRNPALEKLAKKEEAEKEKEAAEKGKTKAQQKSKASKKQQEKAEKAAQEVEADE